jgi:hypothetical protein
VALADVKTRIVEILDQVDGSGPVYDRWIPAREEADVKEMFVDDDNVLNVTFVTSGGLAFNDEDVNQHLVTERRAIVIHSFYAVNKADNSDAEFDALIDGFIEAIVKDRRPPSKFNGTVKTSDVPQMPDPDYREFGPTKVLCHHAEIRIPIVWRDIQ